MAQCFLTGADLSYTNEILDKGGIFKNENGDEVEPFQYFASRGTKIVRLRLWHTPSNNIDYCGSPTNSSSLEDVLDAAIKVKSNGMQLKLSIVNPNLDGKSPVQQILDNMIFVEGGTFTMGCIEDRDGICNKGEKAHSVTLDSFYIAKYEVTQAQYEAVMDDNPSYNKGCDRCPVEEVTWDDTQEFIKKLNQITGKQFRLPTEAEWEYTARGGKKSKGFRYAGSNTLDSVACYNYNCHETIPVGTICPVGIVRFSIFASLELLKFCPLTFTGYSNISSLEMPDSVIVSFPSL